MKTFIKIAFFITFFFIVLSFVACSSKQRELPEVNNLPHYAQVTAIENKNSIADVFDVKNGGLYNIGEIENIQNMVYDIKSAVYVYSVNILKGENLISNKLEIIKDKKKKELKDFYAALDLRINSLGDKIAFRTFSADSIESAEGLKIYDIKNNQYINLESKVLVSGSLYQWIGGNKIIYYGSIQGQKNSTKIYLYDFNSNTEKVYLDNINGYCTYMAPVNNGILLLTKKDDQYQLYYYESKNNIIKEVKGSLNRVYNSITNTKNGSVFLLAQEDEGAPALYKFSAKNLKLERITYDFPKQVDVTAGIGMDDQGDVYFSGLDNENAKDKKDVFMYDDKKGSINLISTHEGKYSIYSSVK
jgi:hypothetical protein